MNYNKMMAGEQARAEFAEPLLLLTDIEAFERERRNATDKYLDLAEVIESIDNIKSMYRYRKFATFIRELRDIGFEFDKTGHDTGRFTKQHLLEQVELLRQCMYYTY